jgi:hypothetical protein
MILRQDLENKIHLTAETDTSATSTLQAYHNGIGGLAQSCHNKT